MSVKFHTPPPKPAEGGRCYTHGAAWVRSYSYVIDGVRFYRFVCAVKGSERCIGRTVEGKIGEDTSND